MAGEKPAAMMQVTARPAPAHAVLVCMPTQGHINPFISIATYLAACGINITFIGSARLHSLLSYAQDSSTSPQSRKAEVKPIRIEVVPDEMPADHTQAVPSTFVESISIIRKGVESVLERLMQEEQPPCCLIVDDLLALWGQDVAVKFDLPWMILWTRSVFCFSVCFHIPELFARGYIPAIGEGSKEKVIDFVSGLSPFCIKDLPKPINVEEDPRNHPRFQFFTDTVKHADRLLVNSIYELESSAVEALRKEAGFHMDPVGPLHMMSSSLSTASHSYAVSLLQEDKGCLSWLDEQQESSVLYIAFGSSASTDDNVVIELAYGLEDSGLKFLWVIRPNALSGKASVQALLPEGFMERTHNRGRIISWAPQRAVLSHPSTGAFLTHCGWNSILESLCNGVPMLGFPQEAEQNTNLKFIVDDVKVGLPLLQPNVQQLERTRVQCVMTAIMQGEEGIELRKCALSIKDIAFKAVHGSSKSSLKKLVDDLKTGHLKASNAPQFQGIEKGP